MDGVDLTNRVVAILDDAFHDQGYYPLDIVAAAIVNAVEAAERSKEDLDACGVANGYYEEAHCERPLNHKGPHSFTFWWDYNAKKLEWPHRKAPE